MVWPSPLVGVCCALAWSVARMIERESRVCERKLVLSTSSVVAREKSGLFKGIPTNRPCACRPEAVNCGKQGARNLEKLRRAQNLSSSLNTSGMQSAAFPVNLFHAWIATITNGAAT
jgi:hypothetical protein